MGYLQKYQEAGIRQVDASGKTSEPIPEVKKSEIALFCGDKYSDAVLLLDEENKTVTHSYFSDKIKYTQTATEYTRSEEHTSELQSLMRISYAVFCLKKKNTNTTSTAVPITTI